MKGKTILLVLTVGAFLLTGALNARAADVTSKFLLHYDYYSASSSTNVVKQEFLVRRARLYFSAKVNDLVSGKIGLEADDNSSTGARTSALKDANVDLHFSPLALVRAGMYKYEFDLSGRGSSSVRPFMDRAIVTNAVAGGLTGAGGDFRDKGVSVIGKTAAYGYGVGAWQGQGPNANDNNNKTAYTANVWGKLSGVKLNLGYLSADNTALGPTATTNKYSASTVGAAYETDALWLQAEYYSAQRKKATTQKLKGYYVMGSYTVAQNVDVMARYQQFQDEKWGTSNNQITSTDLGVKYYLARKGRGGSNVSLNYMVRNADSGVTEKIFDERGTNVTGSQIDNLLMARLQVQF